MRMFAENLAANGFAVTMALPMRKEPYSIAPPPAFQIIYLPTAIFPFVRQLRKWLAANRPDFVHFVNPSRKAMLATLGLLTSKVVGDWEDWHPVCNFPKRYRWPILALDAYLRRRVDVVITCSKWLQREFQRRGRKEVHYIPYGVNATELPMNESPFEEQTAVFMGSFNRHWDQGVVVRAAKILQDRKIKLFFRLIGSGPELSYWKSYANKHKLKNIEFTGFLDDDEMIRSLMHASLLLFPIRDTPANLARCPHKVFLYAQAGRTIVTCKVGEVVEVLGERAIYAECTPIAFADAITGVLQEGRIGKCVDYGMSDHTWIFRANSYANILREKVRR